MNASNLLLRWFLNRPIEWVLEISLILFVYSVMFIVPVLYRDKSLIQMHLIEGIISKGAARYLNLIVDVIILAFLVYLLPLSVSLCAGQIDMLSRGLGIPRIYITLPVPIGVTITLLVSVSNIIHQIPNLRYEV
jgi:TRAP-type C4-dicarboxylate transport system permease small subunit